MSKPLRTTTSSVPPSPYVDLCFGIEIELVVSAKPAIVHELKGRWETLIAATRITGTPKEKEMMTYALKRKALADIIAEKLRVKNIHLVNAVKMSDSEPDTPKGYSKWTVEDDMSIRDNQKKGQSTVALEFVSRTMSITNDNWEEELQQFFQVLHENVSIPTTESCGTHVHISPKPKSFSVYQLKNITKAVLFFGEDISAKTCVRASTPHATPNTDKLSPNYKALYDADKCADLFASLDKDLKTVDDVYALSGSTKFVTWNFTQVQKSIEAKRYFGTIEWRQPPAVTNAADACGYVRYAAEFIAAAMATKQKLGDDDSNTTAAWLGEGYTIDHFLAAGRKLIIPASERERIAASAAAAATASTPSNTTRSSTTPSTSARGATAGQQQRSTSRTSSSSRSPVGRQASSSRSTSPN